jgi:erythronate-4-phosphate dehydrogenase
MEPVKRVSVVADEAIPFLKGVTEPWCDISYAGGSDISPQMLAGTDALIVRTRTRCNRALLEGSSVSFIATATIGYDHIDTEYCHQNNIKWSSAPGCNSGSVMQYMVSAILHLTALSGVEPGQLTMGIVGAGHVGSKVAAAASALGMRVLINDPPRQRREGKSQFSALPKLLKESDMVSLHVPMKVTGQDSTFHLAGREFIASMKRGSILFNTSRGGVTDEEAVKRALWSGKLGGYVADVWNLEPAADQELIDMAMIATPHIAGYSADGKLNGTRMSLQALAAKFSIPLSLPGNEVLPVPSNNQIYLPAGHLSGTEMLTYLVNQTCNVSQESRIFKSDPSKFELLRNNYPTRREFFAYTITGSHTAITSAKKLGFSVIP